MSVKNPELSISDAFIHIIYLFREPNGITYTSERIINQPKFPSQTMKNKNSVFQNEKSTLD